MHHCLKSSSRKKTGTFTGLTLFPWLQFFFLCYSLSENNCFMYLLWCPVVYYSRTNPVPVTTSWPEAVVSPLVIFAFLVTTFAFVRMIYFLFIITIWLFEIYVYFFLLLSDYSVGKICLQINFLKAFLG